MVILGLAESGKSTIIRSVVEGEAPRLGERYEATIHYQRKRKVIADIELVVFDLGGQVRFLDRFTGDLAEFVFSETDIFIFVIEPLKVADFSRAKYYFELSLEKLQQFSPNALLYIFLHKIDLIPDKMVEKVSKNIRNYLASDLAKKYRFYETSVFSESIFIALGEILAEITGIRERLYPLLEEFIQENASILDLVQVLTEKGAILTSAKTRAAMEEVSIEKAKALFDSAARRLAISKELREQDKIVSIESEEFLSYTNFLDNGLAILLVFSKKRLQKNPKLIATLYDRIISLSNQVNEFQKTVGRA